MLDVTLDNAQEKRPLPAKYYLLAFTIGYFITLIVLGLFIYRAAPPNPAAQEVLGVALGDWQEAYGMSMMSGKRLDCTSVDNIKPYTSSCQVDIAGKTLEIQAARNAPEELNQLGGICTAFYDGQEWSCSLLSRHVHVHWFAYIDPPLGLDDAQLETIRQKHFFENLPEQPFVAGVLFTAVATALILVANIIVWFGAKIKWYWLILLSGSIGVIIFFAMLILNVIVTNGFWD